LIKSGSTEGGSWNLFLLYHFRDGFLIATASLGKSRLDSLFKHRVSGHSQGYLITLIGVCHSTSYLGSLLELASNKFFPPKFFFIHFFHF
jgi:hypothetical protein